MKQRKRSRTKGWLAAALSAGVVGVTAAQFLEPDVEILHTHTAEVVGDSYGFVGEAIGDLNGDGASEYLIGAPTHGVAGDNAGKAYVYDGATGDEIHAIDGAPGDYLGWATGDAGDVNADGTPDYCVGGRGTFGTPHPGRVLVVSGTDHSVIHDLSGAPGSFYGYECNGAGDVNGDGHDDVAVGAILTDVVGGFDGRVHLVSGATGADLWTVDGSSGSVLGSAVDGIDDQNGDGLRDVIAGALGAGATGVGEAWVLSGADGAVLDVLEPGATGGSFGWFFAHDAGDVDADGIGDVYVGDFSDSELGPGSGRGYVFSGANGSLLHDFGAEAAADGLGMGRGAGDVDDDEHDDLLLGAYTSSFAAPQGGRVYLRSGATGEVLRTFTGDVAGALIGFDVVTLGDVNDDEHSDWLLTGSDVAYVVAGVDLATDDEGDDEGGDEGDDAGGGFGRQRLLKQTTSGSTAGHVHFEQN